MSAYWADDKDAEFQSTLLMRGATVPSSRRYCRQRFQSTLLMRGATAEMKEGISDVTISIHAPHARSDL